MLAERGIPLAARIVAVADVYDAIAGGKRVYQPKQYTEKEAVAELERAAGTQLDPNAVGVLADFVRRELFTSSDKLSPQDFLKLGWH